MNATPRFSRARRLPAALLLLGSLGLLGACKGIVVTNPTPLDIYLSDPEQEPPRYTIVAQDELEIRFFHTPEQNVILPVRPDGYISLPLVPEVKAAGRTVEELQETLVSHYSKELVDPEVAVIVRTFTAHKVHVGGEVNRPGVFDLASASTVMEAIAEAEGMKPTASLVDVVVIRRKDPNHFAVIPLNLNWVLSGKDTRQNLALQPYDAIYVPRTRIANVNKFVDEYIRKNLPFNVGWRIEF